MAKKVCKKSSDIHKEELELNWGLAVKGEKPNRIEPLK
jgi:hypothetical protein